MTTLQDEIAALKIERERLSNELAAVLQQLDRSRAELERREKNNGKIKVNLLHVLGV